MNLENDLKVALKNWGSIKTTVNKESIELWGNISPKFIIKTYNNLCKSEIVYGPTSLLKRKKKLI
jgi:hypothetical protein